VRNKHVSSFARNKNKNKRLEADRWKVQKRYQEKEVKNLMIYEMKLKSNLKQMMKDLKKEVKVETWKETVLKLDIQDQEKVEK
jgi:hypothetical protein